MENDFKEGGRPGFIPAALAARILGVSHERLKALAEQGALRRFGNSDGHAWYSIGDLEHVRGTPIDDRDIAFAEDRHKTRLASYARSNAKRRPAAPFNPPIKFGDGLMAE